MSRLFVAIKKLAPEPDRAAIGRVTALRGPGRYLVQVGMNEHEVPAAGDASASVGQAVAVIISGRLGRPIAMLGAVRQIPAE